MITRILKPTQANILYAAAKLKAGGLVAFPTETVYALGAVASNPDAVKRVYEVKGRSFDKPLIVAVAKKEDIYKVAKNVPEKAKALIERFMPGALTLVLEKADCIPDIVTAGGSSVAVRIPDNAVAQKIIELAGGAVVVPSANTSDKPSPTLAVHVKDDLDGKIDPILDGGASAIGIESTVIDVGTSPPTVLRVGGVSAESIREAIGDIIIKSESESPKLYAPTADVLFSAFYVGMDSTIRNKYDELEGEGKAPVIICLDGQRELYGDRHVYTVGVDYKDYAHNLFAALRRADAESFEVVIASGVEPVGIGASLIAKLCKLSKGQII